MYCEKIRVRNTKIKNKNSKFKISKLIWKIKNPKYVKNDVNYVKFLGVYKQGVCDIQNMKNCKIVKKFKNIWVI
jgi:outer membrane protease